MVPGETDEFPEGIERIGRGADDETAGGKSRKDENKEDVANEPEHRCLYE
jgi:hypothetical protein